MKYIKRYGLIFFAVIIIVVSVPLQVFAVDPVSFTEATSLGATVIDLYGAVNNTSLAYDQIASSGALTEIVTLYQDYSSSAGDPVTLAAIGAAAAAAGAIAVVYDAITGQGYIQLYQEQYVSSLDGYWDYQLADTGLVRDSITNLFNWSSSSDSEQIYIYIGAAVLPYFANNNWNSAMTLATTGNDVIKGSVNNSNFTVYAFAVPSSNIIYFASANNGNAASIMYNGSYVSTTNLQTFNSENSLYYNSYAYSLNTSSDYSIPSATSMAVGLSTVRSKIDGTFLNQSISVEPSVYIGDPLQNPLEISIPNTSDPDYIPQPKRITTDIPWDPNWGDPLPDGVTTPEYGVPYPVTDPTILNQAAPGIWEYIVTHVVEVVNPDVNPNPDPNPDPSDPTEVYTPFLPVALPSFNFSLSGIWHYVRDWVASLGAWFTMVFEVWSHLPYAIVVPVFASAVIVVVLGVYKRFFM